MDNCKNCLYANELSDGRVFCDKVLLMYGKEVYIDADKTEKPCPAHSNKFIEDWRYTAIGVQDIRKADDACGVCGRLINLNDISQYGYIEVQDEKGTVVDEKLQCRICREKGRR